MSTPANRGIFPRNGVAAENAAPGAQEGLDTVNCQPLFYPGRCNLRIDPQSLNTIISEIANAVNCAGFDYDCDRMDNLCRAIQAQRTPQTRVHPASDSTRGKMSYFVRHFGTWQDETFRTAYVERDGDIANINIWNQELAGGQGAWDIVSVYAPGMTLNNPTFYIRQDTGSANPPINTPDDLTVANAFNSWTAMFNFIERTEIFGYVTVDWRGTFDGLNVPPLTPSLFKNATDIRLQAGGQGTSIIQVGASANGEQGIQASQGAQVRLLGRHQVRMVNSAANPNVLQRALLADSGGSITLVGILDLTGAYNIDRPNASTLNLFQTNDGTINFNYGAVVNFSMNAATKVSNIWTAARNGSINIGPATYNFASNLAVGSAVFNAVQGGRFAFSGGPTGVNDTPPTFSGAGVVTAQYLYQASALGGHENFAFNFGPFANWLEANFPKDPAMANPIYNVDINSYFSGRYGSQWAGDARFA